MTRYKEVFHGILLYIEDGVNVTKLMLNSATQLATIIAGLAVQVYKLPTEKLHLYRDVDGGQLILHLYTDLDRFSCHSI